MSISASQIAVAPSAVAGANRPGRRWPALTAATYIGLFCLVAGAAVGGNVASGAPWGENGAVLQAICLHMLTVAIALASVQSWGTRIPSWMLLAGLWGAAAAQLLYPVAEAAAKALILIGLITPSQKGISNMSPEDWFNFAGTWLVWGIPGVLFLVAALSYGSRTFVRRR